MRLFKRKCSVRIGDVEVSDLRIIFSVSNSTDQESNSAEASVFNLNEDNRNRLLTGKLKPALTIEAGYDQVFGEIYRGKAVEVDQRKDGTNWVLRAAGKDGLDALRKVVNVSLSPGASLDKAFVETLRQLGINTGSAIDRVKKGDIAAATKTMVDGFIAFGRGMDELDKITKKIGAEWSVQGEELQIRLPNETLPGSALLIGPTTGLIDSPERVYSEAVKGDRSADKASSGKLIIRFRHLLLPDFRPYQRIEMDSRSFKGAYRVEKVEHSGDTHGGEWLSTVEAKAL